MREDGESEDETSRFFMRLSALAYETAIYKRQNIIHHLVVFIFSGIS